MEFNELCVNLNIEITVNDTRWFYKPIFVQTTHKKKGKIVDRYRSKGFIYYNVV